jgi:hypothetical protein
MLNLADRLSNEVGEPTKARAKVAPASSPNNGESWFALVNAIDTASVLDALAIEHDDKHATCPGCGEEGALICRDGGLKCLHDRCASAGPADYPGFRSNVDLTATVRGIEPKDAVLELAERFNVGLSRTPNSKQGNEASAGDDPGEPPPGMFEEEEPTQAPRPVLVIRSVSEIFVKLDPIDWLCQSLGLCPGAASLIAGYGFSGKTVVAQALAVAVAAGLRALGTFTVRQGRVLHVDFEQGFRLTAERYQRLCRAACVGPADLGDRIGLVSMPTVYLDSAGAEDILSRACEGIALLIVDSLRAAAPTIDENSSEARLVLDRLTRISERTGCTTLVLHHARKPQRDSQGGSRMSIRGTGGLYDACSSVLVLEADKGQPTICHHEKERVTGKCLDDFLIRIDDEEADGDPRGGLRVTAEGRTPPEPGAPADAQTEAIQTTVVALLTERGSVPSFAALAELLHLNRNRVRAALDLLVAAGRVQEIPVGRGRREIRYVG